MKKIIFGLFSVAIVGCILIIIFGHVPLSGQQRKARYEIETLEKAIGFHDIECGALPLKLEDLISNPKCKGFPKEGILDAKKLIDPWDKKYNYLNPGTHNSSGFDVWTTGPDGLDATEDDITNWRPIHLKKIRSYSDFSRWVNRLFYLP